MSGFPVLQLDAPVSPLDATRLPFVSVVIPALNEQANLRTLHVRLGAVLDTVSRDYEVIIVDDGSADDTLPILRELARDDPHLDFISLSRNFGHQAALVAGLDRSTGQVVITMDADLQHPPELIPKLIALWQQGNQVVYTVKVDRVHLPVWKRFGMTVGYAIIRRTSGLQLEFGQSDFRLLDRRVVSALREFPERDIFLRGLVNLVGFRQIGLEYNAPPRFAGQAKYTFPALAHLVASGVFGFSIVPLRLFTVLGFTISLFAFAYGIWAVALGIYALFTGYSDQVPPGWASLAMAMAFLGGVQLLGIGLLGEYIGRIYAETKHRPIYLIRETADEFPARTLRRPLEQGTFRKPDEFTAEPVSHRHMG